MTFLSWVLHQFCYIEDGVDETFAHDRFMDCVLVFVDETERLLFEFYFAESKTEFVDRGERLDDPYVDESVGLNNTPRREYTTKLKQATVLRGMLDEYRANFWGGSFMACEL